MSKHTEGPWSLAKDGAEVFPIDGPKSHVTVAFVNGAAQESEWFSKEEALANAHLIAAAPELLAALKGVAAAHACIESCDMPEWLDAVESAIAKAEGRGE